MSSAFSQDLTSDPDSIYEQAVTDFDNEKYTEAIEGFSSVISNGMNEVDSYFSRGISYFKSGDTSSACSDWRIASVLGDSLAKTYKDKFCPGNETSQPQPNEIMPQFPGGEKGLVHFLGSNIIYPPDAREQGISGTVYVWFVIDKTGRISVCKILKGIGGGCDQEALRVVLKMPKWEPGRNSKNQPVDVMYNLPIKFTLQGW